MLQTLINMYHLAVSQSRVPVHAHSFLSRLTSRRAKSSYHKPFKPANESPINHNHCDLVVSQIPEFSQGITGN